MLRKWVATGMIGGLLAIALVGSAGARLGVIEVPLQRPDTHWFWYVSRAAGMCAYLALVTSVVWGLLLSTGVADAWVARARSIDIHRWISAVALALIAGHALVLLGDPYVRFDMLDLVVPLVAAYRTGGVALGVLAGYASVAVFGSFWLRRHLGQRGWRLVHYLAFPTVGLVTLHGLLAGSDSDSPWMRLVYVLTTALVLWLVTYRVLLRIWTRVPVAAH